jgi:hypothetical protein
MWHRDTFVFLSTEALRYNQESCGFDSRWGLLRVLRWLNHPSRTMALRSTQSVTKISTRNLLWVVKAAGACGWQPYHLHAPTVWKSWEPRPSRALGDYVGLYRDSFIFTTDSTTLAEAQAATVPGLPTQRHGLEDEFPRQDSCFVQRS